MKKPPPLRQVIVAEKRVREESLVRAGVQTGPTEKLVQPSGSSVAAADEKQSLDERMVRALIRQKLMQPRLVATSPPSKARVVPRARHVWEDSPSGPVLVKKEFVPSEKVLDEYADLMRKYAKKPPGPPQTTTPEKKRALTKARQQKSRNQDRAARRKVEALCEAAAKAVPYRREQDWQEWRKAQLLAQIEVLEKALADENPHLKRAVQKEKPKLERQRGDLFA